MLSFLQSFRPTVPLVNGTSFVLDTGNATSSGDAETYLIDLASPNYSRSLLSETTQSQEEIQISAVNAEAEEDKHIKIKINTLDIASVDENDIDDVNDDDNWNIRSDDEEKDQFYYVPLVAYRSYILKSCKQDQEANEEDGKSRHVCIVDMGLIEDRCYGEYSGLEAGVLELTRIIYIHHG